MTKTLTEQWREGTLDRGYYYYKTKLGKKVIGFQVLGLNYPYDYWHDSIENIQGVLAPVPSYDKVKEMEKQNAELVSKTEKLEKKLAIATKALKEYADKTNWIDGIFMCVYDGKSFADEESAHQALKEMEEVK